MTGIYFLPPTLFIIFISFLIVRGGAIALMITGLDKKRAVFQALSAFTGTGFTTREAEEVMNHPVRRKVISLLMILGNAGIVTVIISATSSLISSKGYALPINVFILIVGVFVIYKVGTYKGFIKKWESFIEDKLAKSPLFEEETVEDLLHFIEGYGLVRAHIKKGSPLAGSPLSKCKICREDFLILGIERGRKWIPIPKPQEEIKEGDRIIVYGNLQTLKNLF